MTEFPRLPTEPVRVLATARSLASRMWGVIPIMVVIALFAIRACLHVAPLDRLGSEPAVPNDPPGSQVYAGSIFVARGGPVIIGFQSDSKVRLTIGSRSELHGEGLVKERIVLPAGPAALRVAAAPTANLRLIWSPVGRRGDPEYVPASSLSPEPPGRATFDSSAGTAPLDGAIALGLVLTLVGSILVVARKRLAAVSRTTWLAVAVVFAAGMAVRLFDLGGFGQTWDEDVNWAAGRNYITNLVSLDFANRSWIWNFEHPPVMKYLDGIGAQFVDGFGLSRALSAIWISLGCALLVPIGTRLFRPRVGILAAAIATLLPPMVAHGQIVGHESPTVLWWSLGVLLALGVHDYLSPDDRIALRTLRIRLAWVGAIVGIAIASRFVNGLLGPLVAAVVVIAAPGRWRRATIVSGVILLPVAAIVVFYLLWPRLWLDPIGALRESIHKLAAIHPGEPFLGAVSNTPGPHYFIVYLFATLPIGVLLAFPAYLWRLIAVRTPAAKTSAIVVGLWVAIPLVVVLSPVRQDGVRYVMPVLLAFALIAAAGLDHIATRLERWTQLAPLVLGPMLVGYLASVLLRVHPYYLDYFGEHTGGAGVVAARKWFETAWWGEGVDRAVAYVNAHAAPNAAVHRECILPAHLAWFRQDLWTPMVRDPMKAAWIVAYSPITTPCRIPADARKVFEVTVDGAVLASVYQRP